MHQTIQSKKSGDIKLARALWSLKQRQKTKESISTISAVCRRFFLKKRSQVRLDLWAVHPKSPKAALGDALRRTEDGAGRALSPAAGGNASDSGMRLCVAGRHCHE